MYGGRHFPMQLDFLGAGSRGQRIEISDCQLRYLIEEAREGYRSRNGCEAVVVSDFDADIDSHLV